ncbi:Rhomboid protease GluP [compost metagenome]
MSISWGYSPKTEKFIPLSDFPADKYLIIVRQAIENLGWKLSHVSESGIIAYTPLSFQSYSEEISVRIQANFAVVKSECVGIQLLFNDYGKNDANLEKLFHEFEYVQYHLQEHWDEQVKAFREYVSLQDDDYFEKAPLATKNKIKNIFNLLLPAKGYTVTPILLIINILFFVGWILLLIATPIFAAFQKLSPEVMAETMRNVQLIGSINRKLVLEGDYWRLITYQFMHASLRHLFFNMYAFVYLGLMIENKIGWKNFLLIYILSGICGGLNSIAFHENIYTVGASGAIMGLFGSMMALLINQFFEKNANKALLVSTGFVLALMLINGSITPMVDNACHLGGLAAGFVITYLLIFDHQWGLKKVSSTLKYANILLLFGVFNYAIFALTPVYQHEEFAKLKSEFDKNMRDFDQVLWMKASYSKSEKEQHVYQNGIKPSKANLLVTKKMAKLKLNEQYTLDKNLKTKLAQETYEAAELLLKDVKSNHQYKNEVTNKINNLIQMQVKFRDSLGHKTQSLYLN